MFAYAKLEQKKVSKDTVQKKEPGKVALMPNLTNIPDKMKACFENLSGFSFDDVRVHYNSDKPAQLQALAYTQGNNVHIAPGQEKHLGHELGHVVQQKRAEVRPTTTLMNLKVNDSDYLEQEADMISVYAMRNHVTSAENLIDAAASNDTIQRRITLARGPSLIAEITAWEAGRKELADKYKDIETMLGHIVKDYFGADQETIVTINLIAKKNACIIAPKASDEDMLLLPPKEVIIQIGRDLICNFSSGNVLALINHEFNVHHLANFELWRKGLTGAESHHRDVSKPLKAGIDHDVRPSYDSQPDHVYAAQRPDDSQRAMHYITKTKEAVKCMMKNPVKTAKAKEEEVKDSKDPFSFVGEMLGKKYPIDWTRTTIIISDYITFYLFDVMRIHLENMKQRKDDVSDLYEDAQARLSDIIQSVRADTSIDATAMEKVFDENGLEKLCSNKLNDYYEKNIKGGLGAGAVLTAKKMPSLQSL